MRVISGEYGGRKLATVEDDSIRPTSDMVKQALFNIIGSKLYDGNFLDLFAGSGAIGIEAISRGANHVCFVDKSNESVQVVKTNLEALKIMSGFEIMNVDFGIAITKLLNNPHKYDIVFIDPPYNKGIAQNAMEQLSKIEVLNKDALLIVEHDSKDVMKDEYGKFILIKRKKYGIKQLSFYTYEEK